MVRKICEADREIYIKMAEEFYHSEAVSHPVPYENYGLAFDHMINDGKYLDGFIMDAEGNTAGFCVVAKTFSQEAGGMVLWIEDFYVLPQYRSKGIGKELFRFIEEEYGDEAVRMRLEITEDNVRARKLYESQGFEMCPYLPMIREMK